MHTGHSINSVSVSLHNLGAFTSRPGASHRLGPLREGHPQLQQLAEGGGKVLWWCAWTRRCVCVVVVVGGGGVCNPEPTTAERLQASCAYRVQQTMQTYSHTLKNASSSLAYSVVHFLNALSVSRA